MTKTQRNKKFRSILKSMSGSPREKSTRISNVLGCKLNTVEGWKTKNGKHRTIPERHLIKLESVFNK